MIRKHLMQKCLLPVGILLALLLGVGTSEGMVYTWRDASGTTHYTNKEYEIPTSYRTRAKKLYPEASDLKAGTQASAVELPQLATTPPPAEIKQTLETSEKQDLHPSTISAPVKKNSASASQLQKGRGLRIHTGEE